MSKRKLKVSRHSDNNSDNSDNDDIDDNDLLIHQQYQLVDQQLQDHNLQQVHHLQDHSQDHSQDHLQDHSNLQDLPINDDFNFFSLDMVTDDMDFEQAYSTYNLLQQKNAISAVEHLKKVQILNQQYDSSFGNYQGYSHQSAEQAQPVFPQVQAPAQTPAHHIHLQQQAQQIKGLVSLDYHSSLNKGEMDDFDHFFSNTESDALEKFLDNLANPSNSPTQTDFYTHQPQRIPQQQTHSQSPYVSEGERPFAFPSYDLHTMKPIPTPPLQQSSHSLQQSQAQAQPVKEELSDAFSHPPSKNDSILQLPTPAGISPGKRAYLNDLESSEYSFSASSSATKKRKRSTTKQLLTVEQKKLNHSYSEQKRRQLCKLAYERCLRLIVNLDEYLNLHKDSKKDGKVSLKKKQKLRDGLPNISKYTALVKISNEITTIQDKNRELQKLLAA